MELYNKNNQLQIVNSDRQEFYKFETMKSFSAEVDGNGNWYALINFIANDKNNSLRLYVKDVTNLGLSNTQTSAIDLVKTISEWANQIVNINLRTLERRPIIIRSTGGIMTGITEDLFSISFASTGTTNATITVNGNSVILKPGESVSYEAGDYNIMAAGYFFYDTSLAGSELLIIYVQ
jgi:hypothetical protein